MTFAVIFFLDGVILVSDALTTLAVSFAANGLAVVENLKETIARANLLRAAAALDPRFGLAGFDGHHNRTPKEETNSTHVL
jgi:hypothetical protein